MPRPAKDQAKAVPLYTVAIRFQDANGLKAEAKEDGEDPGPLFYEVGDDVSHFEPERLERAVGYGIVQHNAPDQTETTEE